MSTILEELILPSVVQMGLRLEESRSNRNCGVTYSVLPEVGDGFYWVYGYKDQFAVVVYNLTLKETIQPKYRHPAFYTIGSYNRFVARLISEQAASDSRVLLGYHMPEAIYHQILHKGCSAKGVSLSLSAPFAEQTAALFDMSIGELTERCFSLNGTEQIPEAVTVLSQVQTYTPTERFAHRYYESKLMELIAILCQRHELKCPALPQNNLQEDEKLSLRRVVDYIHAHYMEDTDLKALGGVAYMGRTKLIQTFKQMYGVTITQYLRQLRVEHAKSLLKDGRQPLGQIAVQVGYRSQGSFSDLFKDATGLTPREYRRLFGENTISTGFFDQ